MRPQEAAAEIALRNVCELAAALAVSRSFHLLTRRPKRDPIRELREALIALADVELERYGPSSKPSATVLALRRLKRCALVATRSSARTTT